MNQQIWPGWETVREIACGGFGTVYEIRKAEDNTTGEFRSALKVITIPQSPEEYRIYEDDGYDEKSITAIFKSQVDDIVSEFQIMYQFADTSNIVGYKDHKIVPHADGKGWDILIRMELLTSLPDYLKQHGTSEADTIKLGQDICQALELCGQKDIIHRDIKPQNIFVNQHGNFKLGDFGIAKSMDHTTKATKIGTYNYMAPEVYCGKPYNASVDIYSLGLVMYWLLNERRLPFVPIVPSPTATQNNEAQRRLSGEEAIPAPKHGNPALKAVVLKAIAFDPAERFSSPRELLAALNSCESASEQVYTGTESYGESTVTGGTELKHSSQSQTGKLNTDGPSRDAKDYTTGGWSMKFPPPSRDEETVGGGSTRGIWDDPPTDVHWTQDDPSEEEEPHPPTTEKKPNTCCPWCKGSGKEMRVHKVSAERYWASLEPCWTCSDSVPKDKEALWNMINGLRQTSEGKSANVACPCCGGRGWVHMEEKFSPSLIAGIMARVIGSIPEWRPCPECQGKHVEIPTPVRKRKAIALLLLFPIGCVTGATCFYEGRYVDGLVYLALVIAGVLLAPLTGGFSAIPYCLAFFVEVGIICSRPKGSYLMSKGKVVYDWERAG